VSGAAADPRPGDPVVFPVNWMRTGPLQLFRSIGSLHLTETRIRFDAGGRCVFDEPVGAVGAVAFPRYGFGTVVKLRVAGRSYRFALEQPTPSSLLDVVVDTALDADGDLAPDTLTARERGRELRRRLGRT
jgi:hypothetical protein